jgi:hypothetical protein
LQFGESVPRLRDEVGARAGLDKPALNASIEQAANDPSKNVQAVRGIVKGFWDLALEINV